MSWSKGLAKWEMGDTIYLSIAFTWLLDEAYSIALFARACGQRVIAGGPALFLIKKQHLLADVAEIGTNYPDAVAKHNPMATFASRGCPVGCWFCIVPKMEGKEFTFIPDFPVRPVLCDNNLSALPVSYQLHIIERYEAAGVPLLDANSGFEPRTFDEFTYLRWSRINRGPWRFAFDDMAEREEVRRTMRMLRSWAVPPKLMRVYVLVGNEPYAECMGRIREVIEWGGEPHVQFYVKLNAPEYRPHVRFDWTEQKLVDVRRWANGFAWRKRPFEEYDRQASKKRRAETYDEQQGLFV